MVNFILYIYFTKIKKITIKLQKNTFFPKSQFFTSDGQSIGASVLCPSNEYSGLIASRIDHPPHENSAVTIFFVFANLIVGKKVFFVALLLFS